MSTATATHTNTYVYARHIANKVVSDLKRLQQLYGISSPTDGEIDAYDIELQMLLNLGYLGTITYGYKRNGTWIVALKYEAIDGIDSGGIRLEADLRDSVFSSFLTYSSHWYRLSEYEKEKFQRHLPFQRREGEEPNIESGYWADTGRYTAGELGVRRFLIQVG